MHISVCQDVSRVIFRELSTCDQRTSVTMHNYQYCAAFGIISGNQSFLKDNKSHALTYSASWKQSKMFPFLVNFFSVKRWKLQHADCLDYTKPNTSSQSCCLGNKGSAEKPRVNNSVRCGDSIGGEATGLWGLKQDGVCVCVRVCLCLSIHELVLERGDFGV